MIRTRERAKDSPGPEPHPVRRRVRATPHPASLLTHVAALPDPRRPRRRHRPLDPRASALCAVRAGCDDWAEVAAYGRTKPAWLLTSLPLPHGIPSHDTPSRAFRLLQPRAFRRCFRRRIEAVQAATGGTPVAIDGKTLRHSCDTAAGPSALPLVSAWAGQNRLALARRAVGGHSHESTALPELVRLLDRRGAVVTRDALGCPKEIVAVPAALRTRPAWRDLRGVGMADAARQVGDGGPSGETRLFRSGLRAEVKAFARAVRGHWGIENGLHGVRDVAFGEDASRVRKGQGPGKRAWLRRVAVSLPRNEPTAASVTCKRKPAGWDNDDLRQVLLGNSGGS